MTSRPEVDWPDWSGQTALIVGTGPSAAVLPLQLAARSAKCIAIKSAWKFAEWADVLYGIDVDWWLANRGAPQFKGLKVTPSPTAARLFRLRQAKTKLGARILLEPKGTVGCGLRHGGGHSGWQAINLAVQLGSRRIVLVGFEMRGPRFNSKEAGVARFDPGRVERWRQEMDEAAGEFAAIGCEVINATPDSALTAYPYQPFEEVFAWRSGRRSRRSTVTSQ